MKASLIVADSRDAVACSAPWANVIEPLAELKDGWIAADTREAYEYAFANRAKFLPTGCVAPAKS